MLTILTKNKAIYRDPYLPQLRNQPSTDSQMACRSSTRLSAKRSAAENSSFDSPPPAPKKTKKFNFGAASLQAKRKLSFSDDEKEDEVLAADFLSDNEPTSPSPKRVKLGGSLELAFCLPCAPMDDLEPIPSDSVIQPSPVNTSPLSPPLAPAPVPDEAELSDQEAEQEEDAEANLISEEEAELIYNANLDDLQDHLLDPDVDSPRYKETCSRLAINLLNEQSDVSKSLIRDAKNFLEATYDLNNPVDLEEFARKKKFLDHLCDMIGLPREN